MKIKPIKAWAFAKVSIPFRHVPTDARMKL
jgi:hypothetical protein